MQVSTSPTPVPLPFADSGTKNVIPEAASPTPGLASLTTGFPPVTMTPLAAGGIPPAGQDMNGILNLISQTTRWTQAGGPFAYSSSFATDSNVNGYPQGAVISRADYTGQWISTADNNTINPDTVGTNWVPGYNYGVTAVTGLTNANVTLTPAQAAKNRITLAGTLTGNVQIIFPTWTKDWTIINNTTGAFTATAKTAAGTGVAIPQDASPTKVTGDGTNITQLAENIPPATASQHAAQLGQMQTAVGAVGFQSIAATVASNALTATLTAPGAMSFRNPTLTSGAAVSASIASNLSLTVPSTATLGVIAATQTRLVWLIAYNGGTPVLCVANITGGLNLDETTLISPTTISTGSTSSNVIYSASAVSANSPFRVVGFCDITEATPGTWATGPTTVQGIGGQALAALSSIGYGQTWQNPSRTLATTYYNTTGKPIQVVVTASSTNTNSGILLTINGSIGVVGSSSSAANTINSVTAIVPPGDSYAVTIPAGGASLNTWSELR